MDVCWYRYGSQQGRPASTGQAKRDFMGGEKRLAEKSLSERTALQVCFGTKWENLRLKKVDRFEKVI